MTTIEASSRATRPGLKTWRAAIVVFLTVLLGGLGLTAANALWSQSGSVTTQVSTGEWVDYSRPGFSMPVTMAVDDAEVLPWVRRSIRLSWTHEAELDAGAQNVTYRVEATEIDKLKVHGRSLPYQGSATEVTIQTTTPVWPAPPEKLRITVTPYVNGVAGAPTVKDLWLDRDRNTWLTDVE